MYFALYTVKIIFKNYFLHKKYKKTILSEALHTFTLLYFTSEYKNDS